MCVTAAVIAGASLAASAAGSAVSIRTAKANARNQRFELDLQNKQLSEERELARLQAIETENGRLEEFRRTRAANAAAIAASGVDENRSFLQGIAPAEERALARDLGNIRMGLATQTNRVADQIRVNRASRDIVGFNSRAQQFGAAAGFVAALGETASLNATYRTPSKKTGGIG